MVPTSDRLQSLPDSWSLSLEQWFHLAGGKWFSSRNGRYAGVSSGARGQRFESSPAYHPGSPENLPRQGAPAPDVSQLPRLFVGKWLSSSEARGPSSCPCCRPDGSGGDHFRSWPPVLSAPSAQVNQARSQPEGLPKHAAGVASPQAPRWPLEQRPPWLCERNSRSCGP